MKSIQAVRVTLASLFFFLQGSGLGWKKASVRCSLSPVLSERLTPKHACSVTFCPQQSCCGVGDGGVCLGNAVWLESSV